MKLIIALGNPGSQYKNTRHNLGWLVIDELSKETGIKHWENKERLKTKLALGTFKNQKIILAKPQLFMNESGLAVKLLKNYYKVPLEAILVIHDELDFELGRVKIQQDKGTGGHRGIESAVKHLRSKEFFRMRLGIKPKNDRRLFLDKEDKIKQTEKFVLGKFTDQEQKIIKKAIKKAVNLIITTFLASNLHQSAREPEE